MEEHDGPFELIIQSIDDEFNEEDWMVTNDDERHQRQFDNLNIWFLNSNMFPKTERPIVLLDRCNLHSLRHQLKIRHRLLLEAYYNNRFYVCHINEMKRKVIEYMNRTGAYIIVQDLNEIDNNNHVDYILNTIMKELTEKLDHLRNCESISEDQSRQMRMDPFRIRLDFLTFQPDIQQVRCFFPFFIICQFYFYH
jgi:hypothetical protein